MEGRLASLKLGFVMLMTASLVAACSKGGGGSSSQSTSQNSLRIAAYKAAGTVDRGTFGVDVGRRRGNVFKSSGWRILCFRALGFR